jgi:hypothetical protein
MPYLILLFFLPGCIQKQVDLANSISIQWKDSIATGLIIPRSFFSDGESESLREALSVRLKQENPQPPIFGDYVMAVDQIVFQPLVPLTRGLSYEILLHNQPVAAITIPPAGSARIPEVVAVYPSQDTLPENLLKFYLVFSQPMHERQVLQHVTLIADGRDTLPAVFMDLQPALWNRTGTMLTLWLDPGRIKRDLLPNQRMGPPLSNGRHYQLVVFNTWRSKDGIPLQRSFSKNFVVGPRDNNTPSSQAWSVELPRAESKEPLRISLLESLDYVLLQEAINIYDEDNNIVRGEWSSTEEETILNFNPSANWSSGSYHIRIESRLEDLAGNNPNRLFDRDVSASSTAPQQDHERLPFVVR